MSFPNHEASNFGRLVDLSNQEVHVFNWNPTELDESIKANFARQTIPGLSHQRSQFLSTGNREIEFVLVVDGIAHGGPQSVERVRNFLLSTMYPRASKRIDGAGAPKMLLLLPGAINSKGYVDSVKISHKLFYSDLKLRRFEATVKFIEEPDQRITSSDVRNTELSNQQTNRFMDFRNHPPFVVKKNAIDFSNSPPFVVKRS